MRPERTSISDLQAMKSRGEKIAMLTCYDASFASLMETAGIDALLVGDSLGMVLQGASDTLGVSLVDMAYHTRCVAKGATSSFIIADMPIGSDDSPETALNSARQLIMAGAYMVKLEGNKSNIVSHLVNHGIPVCGHLGFTPQTVHELGGFKVQGRDEESARRILNDAQALQQAGASMLVLEMIPAALAKSITEQLTILTIGIGACVDCDGQVLVMHDMLGVYPGKTPRFVRNFLSGVETIPQAFAHYVSSVKQKSFPAAEHTF